VKTLRNEQGFVLVTGLLTLVVLTFLGLAATSNTSIELKIAGNDRLNQENFYDAEGTLILGTEILEQNFNCSTGFGTDGTTADVPDMNEPRNKSYAQLTNQVRAYEQENGLPPAIPEKNGMAFWQNPQPREWDESTNTIINYRDIYDPDDADAIFANTDKDPNALASGINVGYLYLGGFAEMLPGGALQMAAGYEGKGKGSASGGVARIVDIYSIYNGELNSQTCVVMGWRHLVGSEGDCIYD
jgi:hypothetical protein